MANGGIVKKGLLFLKIICWLVKKFAMRTYRSKTKWPKMSHFKPAALLILCTMEWGAYSIRNGLKAFCFD